MAKQVYWLSDAEWRRIEPLLPRGRKGAHRVDDRRVISGIMQHAEIGFALARLPRSLRTLHDGLQPLQPLEPTRGVWTDIFYVLTGSTGMYGSMSVDSSYIKPIAPRPAQKGGLQLRVSAIPGH